MVNLSDKLLKSMKKDNENFWDSEIKVNSEVLSIVSDLEENEDLGIKAATVWAEALQKKVFPNTILK